ncbi:MAG: hydrogenase expression/formation C-terminal domain-containing protein [Pseudomonadota bacterium]
MIGPGSQPEDQDGTLNYLPMPSGMTVFSVPSLPEPGEAEGREAGKAALHEVLRALESAQYGETASAIDITSLDAANRSFVDQVLGEGEVSVVAAGTHQAQESVLAGVWRVHIADDEGRIVSDLIEIGSFPQSILDIAFSAARHDVAIPQGFGANVFNAPALLPEINEHIAKANAAAAPHVINLSLLPHTLEDLALLDQLLGKGDLVILSRGYGNCRVTSTRTRNVWWVQYYNSQDTLILNSIEVTRLPEVVRAASEDLAASAERLREILEVYE